MSRHRLPRERSRTGLAAAVFAAVTAMTLVIAGVVGWRAGLIDPLVSAFASGCGDRVELTVAVDPEAAAIAADVAADLSVDDEACVLLDVREQESADTAAVVAAGALAGVDAWIPDSTVWLDRATSTAASLGRPAPAIEQLTVIAATPVVLAAPAARADELGEAPSWSRVAAETLPTLLPDPEQSAASLAGLPALRAAVAGEEADRRFAAAMIRLGREIPADLDQALAMAATADAATVVVTTEHAVAARNAAGGTEPWVAIYPSEGAPLLQLPFVDLAPETEAAGTAAEGEPEGERAADRRAVALATVAAALEAAEGARERAGFRAADGSGTIGIAGVVERLEGALSPPPAAEQLAALRSWSVLTLRSRMLAVIDVSGSMEEPAGGGLRRIDVFQQAALAAVQRFPGEAELGVWVFSTERVGGQDWEDLVPVEPLADPAQLARIAEVIDSLPGRLGGATGLYDTVLAATDRARQTWEPDKVNSVLLITDGRNEDADGLSLEQLIAELDARADPARPVPVIMIGFGPDTDLAAMSRIAEATGGGAYSATRPEDLGTVLVDALSQRTCRPDCG
ncbi:VWA domain-containing protein [Microcella alkalica]|uniref:VWA domain-containing protein n=1 Tax=Microcella alkalica TaxID=355930 RepID=UPI00145F5BBD|nr:VWA domain-containing protein [Microcella alkalica]